MLRKIGIGLVRNIDCHAERRLIAARVVRILSELGGTVVAEDVETAAELETIKELGVYLVQGFYLGRSSLTELQRKPLHVLQVSEHLSI